MILLRIALLVLLLTISQNIHAQQVCPKFTPEQEELIHTAYYKGYSKDLGYTLASIVWQESFVANRIIKMNTNGSNNSFGITHIELSTAMWLLDVKSHLQARDEIFMRLVTDDDFALDLALMKLHTLRKFSWRRMVGFYNGINSDYGEKIIAKVTMLRFCYKFKEVIEYVNMGVDVYQN